MVFTDDIFARRSWNTAEAETETERAETTFTRSPQSNTEENQAPKPKNQMKGQVGMSIRAESCDYGPRPVTGVDR
ncbi:hypothetical protein SARC_07647 [Sphaeroforma arctica JP610]|uniref:Uncharacterized protein n=1 Tax=Sphaeroforma arctica JP610 TaxID=667725 RepID=A0A0L0FT51_9EUKA|nr:hypothetical protein SARC_07647 [Sphaeroforma arctica JP610]KNC79977.1 hypothetical protein SARC_07647 [Sphaeroforma arctica JP610]|eukprot:XP_014153879.1 hypothetical protein SARC_07647 [Sphaeroforma arctica JP610]